MPLYNTIQVENGIIGIWQLTESLEELSSVISDNELINTEFTKYSFEPRKCEWLSTRLLIKELLGQDYLISYSATGKPHLTHKKFKYISISHSRHFVTVFINEKNAVGIDIEQISRNFNAVKKRYLSDQELEFSTDQTLLCLLWSAKEAIFKLIDNDGVEFREQINIEAFKPGIDKLIKAQFQTENEKLDIVLKFHIFDNHCLVWTSNSNSELAGEVPTQ
jgi:4'-phosphopantetheinyl transferase